ncbi:uncharacterized protein KGF55_001762 [Candida pseudojiufengensis]|uniref:uncharacterized protein n=1 Tax=Candida pseudojiufengensis TaxID=497109 RepID=UPI0022240ABF|nr:uncharacterized protein KGF55_001762 [Candida pseudojiufengensis]KAI5964693.1 hypothetical protein KGF55_001762 [Candida pseudojiufengensis]
MNTSDQDNKEKVSTSIEDSQLGSKKVSDTSNDTEDTLVAEKILKNEISNNNQIDTDSKRTNTLTKVSPTNGDEAPTKTDAKPKTQNGGPNSTEKSNRTSLTSATETIGKLKKFKKANSYEQDTLSEVPKKTINNTAESVEAIESSSMNDKIDQIIVEDDHEPDQPVRESAPLSFVSSKESTNSKTGKRFFFKSVKQWFFHLNKGDSENVKHSDLKVGCDFDEVIEEDLNEAELNSLTELPSIPIHYRSRENGFGILTKSQTLPMKIKKQYFSLLTSAVVELIEFSKYLEILNERSKHENYLFIKHSFSSHFSKVHSELPFTRFDLKTNETVNQELLLQLKILFNDLFQSNYIIWIVNKFEYNGFGKRFRKLISQTLAKEFTYDVSYDRELFYKHVIAASLLEWRKNIPFPE